MRDLIAWWLVTNGLTIIITTSAIMEPLRRLLRTKFIQCSMCMGFWVGIALAWAIPTYCPIQIGSPLLICLANAFASSAACWMTHVVLVRLGAENL